jgi:hypothetical protein
VSVWNTFAVDQLPEWNNTPGTEHSRSGRACWISWPKVCGARLDNYTRVLAEFWNLGVADLRPERNNLHPARGLTAPESWSWRHRHSGCRLPDSFRTDTVSSAPA